jgi:hypothetical protein
MANARTETDQRLYVSSLGLARAPALGRYAKLEIQASILELIKLPSKGTLTKKAQFKKKVRLLHLKRPQAINQSINPPQAWVLRAPLLLGVLPPRLAARWFCAILVHLARDQTQSKHILELIKPPSNGTID